MSDDQPSNPYDLTPTRDLEPTEVAAPSPAWQRFHACRWHKVAGAGTPAYCTHRDVVSMAGTAGFSADAWCPDCVQYKLKRIVRRSSFA